MCQWKILYHKPKEFLHKSTQQVTGKRWLDELDLFESQPEEKPDTVPQRYHLC